MQSAFDCTKDHGQHLAAAWITDRWPPVGSRCRGRRPSAVGSCRSLQVLTRIWLVSVCGIDFASRVHDHVDLTHYIKNWKEVDQGERE